MRSHLARAAVSIILTVAVTCFVVLVSTTSPRAPVDARGLRPTNEHRRIEVSLVLRLPRQAALNAFLARAGDRRLAPRQFGARFGLSLAQIGALRRRLQRHRLTVARGYPQRTALEVTATVGALESVFRTRLVDRIDPRGRRYFAPLTAPRLPRWFGRDVLAVTGLDTRPVLQPADVPAGGLDPRTLSTAYDIAPLHAAGINGAGQTVAVVSFDSFAASDLSGYESHFGISGPVVEHVRVDGGTLPGPGQQEVNLDIDTIRAIAPGAQILDYEAPQGAASDADVINRIVADHRAQVISTSWGRCDLLLTPAERIADDNALVAARAAGITVFAASGDNGAYDCQAADLSDRRPSVDWPAASANVVAVGGTRLAVRRDGSYLAEYGWEDVLKGDGSGGGLASTTRRPAWQQGPGVQNASSDGHRQLPDVSGPADPASGVVVFARGALHEIGGTSAAAPFWAAATLLMRAYAERHHAGSVGFLAPLLYRLAADPSTARAFHQAVRGGNRRYSVTPGWNYVTGLGSPDVAVLARELVGLQQAR